MSQVHLFIKQLVSNEQFRRLAVSNPRAALSQYQLSASEEESLRRLCLRVSSQGTLAAEIGPMGYWA